MPLKRISDHDIVDGYSDVVSDDSFQDSAGNSVSRASNLDYKFTTTGSTGVSGNSDIPEIASGNDAAEGVGLQFSTATIMLKF